MSVLPDVNATINDGGLGIVAGSSDTVGVKLGACAGGVANTFYSFSDPKLLVATLVGGPAVEAAAYQLGVAGGPVYVMPTATSTAGTLGAVTHVGTGPSATMTGAPNDGYEPIARIVTGGAVGTASFQYALDASNPAGPSWSAVLATASTYVLPGTGITLGFPAGIYVASETYAAVATAPAFTASDLNTAFTALLADPREWGCVHVVGTPATGTAAAAIAAIVDSNMTAAEQAYRYAFAITEASDTDANLIAAFASFASKRVGVAVATEELTSTITGRVQTRSSAWAVAARAALVPVSESLAKVARGALPGVVSLNRDEQATPGLDAQRFITLRSFIGRQGKYITRGLLMAPTGSDFGDVHHRRVMDRACKVARDALLTFLNGTVRVNTDGSIYELDARSIEGYVSGQMSASLLPAHASSLSIRIDRTANVLSTRRLPVTIRIVPLGYIEGIDEQIGFVNPSLILVKAALEHG